MRSVAIATYQGMPYIKRQIGSILPQLAEDDEIVISDNGSTDGTEAYLAEMETADPRIRVFHLVDTKGVLANFQNALQYCMGDIIFLCDQDDMWIEGRMDKMTVPFQKDPKLMAVQVNADLIDANDRVTAESFFAIRKSGPGIWKNLYKNTWQGCNMAFRCNMLDLILPFPRWLPMHDMWIGILAELSGTVLFLPEVMSHYRRHGGNLSAASRSAWYQVILWRAKLMGAIIFKLPQIQRFRKLLK